MAEILVVLLGVELDGLRELIIYHLKIMVILMVLGL